AAGMAPAAQTLAEVVGSGAAAVARRCREWAAGQALVAEVDLGAGPRDAVALAPVALGRQPQRRVGAGRGHAVLVLSVGDVGAGYSGGVERGLPSRGVTAGGVPPLPFGSPSPFPPLAASVLR